MRESVQTGLQLGKEQAFGGEARICRESRLKENVEKANGRLYRGLLQRQDHHAEGAD